MLSTRDKVWERNFCELKDYIDEHHHLPDKKKVENRGLLNRVKYNRKKIKAGTLDPAFLPSEYPIYCCGR